MPQACSSWIQSVSLLHPFWTLSEGTILDSVLFVDSQVHLVAHFLLDNRLSFLFMLNRHGPRWFLSLFCTTNSIISWHGVP